MAACLETMVILMAGLVVLPCSLFKAASSAPAETNNSSSRVPVTAQQLHHQQLNQSNVCTVCAPSSPADQFANTTATPTNSSLPETWTSLGGSSISTHDIESTSQEPNRICVHKVSTDAYDGMIPLPDASGRFLLWSKRGVLYLGTSGSDLRLITSLFIDFSEHVHHEAHDLPGMISVATDEGGRIFVSYTTVMADNCTYLVIEELLAASADEATPADPSQVRRVFSRGLTQVEAHTPSALLDYVGQILWRHTDVASLYLASGPTANELQGKILRLRVDKKSGPDDRPIKSDVFATGLGIPRRCSFDSDKPDDLYCASIEAQQEVVYLISDGQPRLTSVVMTHERPAADTVPSIVGGLMYRGSTDSSLFGSYIYLHNLILWAAVESPLGSRHYAATQITRVMCPSTSPFPCRGDNIVGSVVSFAEDGNKNAFIITTGGVYRVVAPSVCHTSTRAPKQLHFPNWLIALLAVLVPAILGTVAYKIRCQCCNGDVHNNA